MQELGIVEGPLNTLHALIIQVEFHILKPYLTSPLYRKLRVKQRGRIDVVAWLRLDPHPREHWPVVTSPVVLVAAVLVNVSMAASVVFEEDSVGVRWALLVFVLEFVLIDMSLVSWHEGHWLFNVAWE